MMEIKERHLVYNCLPYKRGIYRTYTQPHLFIYFSFPLDIAQGHCQEQSYLLNCY